MKTETRCLYIFSLQHQPRFSVPNITTSSPSHPFPTKLEEPYLFLTALHIATLHIVGAQEELTMLKGEAFTNTHVKKGLQFHPQSSTNAKVE